MMMAINNALMNISAVPAENPRIPELRNPLAGGHTCKESAEQTLRL